MAYLSFHGIHGCLNHIQDTPPNSPSPKFAVNSVLFQKEHSNRYSKTAFIKYIQNYVRDELWRVNPEDAHLTYTGKPVVRKMTESELATFEREIAEND
jgi:hypothetical protein